MVTGKEEFHMFGNGHRENIIFTLNAGESATCYFRDDGTDTSTDKYYNLRSEAKKVSIMVSKVASMTHIDSQELKYPVTLTVGGRTYKDGIQWKSIKVRADQDMTTFEIYAS